MVWPLVHIASSDSDGAQSSVSDIERFTCCSCLLQHRLHDSLSQIHDEFIRRRFVLKGENTSVTLDECSKAA